MSDMTIGELARRTGLAVRTLRFYADAGVLPETSRSESGYRLFGPDAVARARLLRTLRELGVGLQDIRRVLAAEVSLSQIADRHARALDAQIRTLRLQRAVLRAVATSTNAEELQRMTDLTSMTADERHRILDDYLQAVFTDRDSPVAERIRTGAPELPDDPSADQVAAWSSLSNCCAIRITSPPAAAWPNALRPTGQRPTVVTRQWPRSLSRPAPRSGPVSRPTRPRRWRWSSAWRRSPPAAAAARLQRAERVEAFTDRPRLSLLDARGHRQRLARSSALPHTHGGRLGVDAKALRAHA